MDAAPLQTFTGPSFTSGAVTAKMHELLEDTHALRLDGCARQNISLFPKISREQVQYFASRGQANPMGYEGVNAGPYHPDRDAAHNSRPVATIQAPNPIMLQNVRKCLPDALQQDERVSGTRQPRMARPESKARGLDKTVQER